MFDQFEHLFFFFRDKPVPDDSLWIVPLVMEFLFWSVVLLWTLVFLKWHPRWIERLEDGLARFSQQRMRCVVLVGVLALGMRAALLPWMPAPFPIAHDEHSYVFQAQTFNSGHITNPAHRMWIHFETYHINMRPTYQSMYPPGQGAFLALGLRLTGNPWIGVWLSMGLMCSAICWMLQGWLPARWALLGSLFCVLRFSIIGNWINSYWGGAVAALGGALVLGALPRILANKSIVAHSLLFAAGLAVLANTRPFEGFVLSILPCAVLLLWAVRQYRVNPVAPRSALACFAGVLLPVAAGMLYYNWRGTGHPFLMPYMLNQQTYHISRPFLWQTRYDFPHYNHFMMKKLYYFHELPDYLRSRHLYGVVELTEEKLHSYYNFFVWPLLIAFLPTCLVIARNKRLRLLLCTALLLLIALLVQLWTPEAHYAAPGACLAVLLVAMSVRLARLIRFGKFRVGIALSRAMGVSMFALLTLSIVHNCIEPWDLTYKAAYERERVTSDLSKLPGRHLVIVHAQMSSAPAYDWIYNEPDIDHSKIAWARDMGTEKNQELLDYFSDRHIWFIDHEGTRFYPYDQRPMAPVENYATVPPGVTVASQIAQAHQREIHAK